MSLIAPSSPRLRIAFLLLLAIGISLLFYQVIEGFLLALVLAAALAGLSHPIYRRLVVQFRGRRMAASGATVMLSLVVVIVPAVFFLSVLVNEALEISEKANEWIGQPGERTGQLQQKIEAIPALQRWLPHQDQILAKAGELAGRAGGFVAQQLAAGAKGTASFFLMLFVMLYAMFYFLMEGRQILKAVFRFTPLSGGDKERLLETFVSVARATLKGTLVIGVVQGGLAGLSFAVAGIPGAVFWGSVMAVLSIIPGIGTPLVWIPAVIYLGLQGEIVAAVGVGIWCAVVVGTADNVLRPLLIGKDTQMPDLLVLLTTLGGLMLFGAVGIVIGPIVGALFLTVWQLLGKAVEEGRDNQGDIEDGKRTD